MNKNKKNWHYVCLIRVSKSHLKIIRCDLYPPFVIKSGLVMYKVGWISPHYVGKLKGFLQSDGRFHISEPLLMTMAKAFKVDYEDLWNKIYL